MFRFLMSSLAVLLMGTPVLVKNAHAITPRETVAATSQPAAADASVPDADAEREFLRLANAARAEAGLEALQMDAGMTRAARAHTAVMIRQQGLSHQFPGEPALMQRLMASSSLHLDQAGENVGVSSSPVQGHEGFMHSPPHRENLLHPAYNMVGIGAMWSGTMLYVTEDFGRSLPTYSVGDAEKAVAESIARMRRDAVATALRRIDNAATESTACAMAKADSIDVPGPQGHTLLRYTTMRPQDLPNSVRGVIKDPQIQGFAVGVCDARTATYPSGAYWVVLILY
ncbi:MAG: CAP domain-containing protein [Terriglobales bacterium]